MTQEEITSLLEVLMNTYPNTKIKDAQGMVNTWELAFGNMDADVVYQAARAHMDTSKFFPTPADIKSLLVKGQLLYDAPAAPNRQIEASLHNYTEDEINFLDNIVDTKPCQNCLKCDRYSICWGDNC